MKRRKKLWIMSGVLILALVLTLSVALIDHKMEKIQESGEVILQVSPDTVTALSWNHEGETLSFTKDDSWHYAGDEEFPVSAEKLEDMLEAFNGLAAAFRIEEVEDYGQYGLETPVCTIDFTAGDQSYQVKLGDYSKMDDQRYVDIGDGNVYLVLQDPMMEFDLGIRSVIDNDRVTYLDQAKKITFTGEESYTILREPENGSSHREEDLYFAQKDGKLLPLDTTRVEDYLSNLTLMELTDYQSYTASQEDLTKYGLDQPELTVQVEYEKLDRGEPTGETETATIYIGRNQEALQTYEEQLQKEETPEPVPAYARVGDSEIIYELLISDYDRSAAYRYDDLRHQEVFPANTEDVMAMDIQLDGSTYRLEGKEEEDIVTFSYEGQEMDISQILTGIRSLHADEFTDQAPDGKLELKLTATLKDGSQVILELYRKDGEKCLAKVDGQSLALLPRTQVVDLMEMINSIVLNPVEVPETTEEAAE